MNRPQSPPVISVTFMSRPTLYINATGGCGHRSSVRHMVGNAMCLGYQVSQTRSPSSAATSAACAFTDLDEGGLVSKLRTANLIL